MENQYQAQLNTNDIPIIYKSEGIEISTLIIIIVSGLILIIVIVAVIYCCLRKKPKEIVEEKDVLQNEIEVNKDSNKLKQFIKIDQPEKADKNNREYNLSGLNDKSVTDRKLLGNSEPSQREIKGIKDSFLSQMEMSNIKVQNKNSHLEQIKLEASFRDDLYKIDTQQDKFKELIQVKNRKGQLSNDVIQYQIENNEEKTSRDIAAENIHNYTDGNRGDFYSEGQENDEEIEEDNLDNEDDDNNIKGNKNQEDNNQKNEIHHVYKKPEYNINKNISASGATKENTFYNSNYRRENEQDMTPQEHSDFLDDDEYDESEQYNANFKYVDNMKHTNRDFSDDLEENELPSEPKKYMNSKR